MNCEEKLLNKLLSDLSLGEIRLQRLEKKAGEGSLKRAIYKQRIGYLRHKGKVENALGAIAGKKKKLSFWKKLVARNKAWLTTLRPLNDSELASLAIKRSTEEIINVTQTINLFPLVDEKVAQVAHSFIKYQQGNIDNYREYL